MYKNHKFRFVEAYQPNSLFSPLTIGPLCHRDSVLLQADDNSFSNNKYEWSGATLLGSGDSTWIQFNDTASTNIKLSIKKEDVEVQLVQIPLLSIKQLLIIHIIS